MKGNSVNDVPIQIRPVVITNVQIPFWSMVELLVKLALAAIPAMILLGGAAFLIMTLFAAIGRGLGSH